MPKRNFSYLVSKVLHDPEFASKFDANAKEALQEIGIEPTDEILKAIENVDVGSIKQVSEAFGDKDRIT